MYQVIIIKDNEEIVVNRVTNTIAAVIDDKVNVRCECLGLGIDTIDCAIQILGALNAVEKAIVEKYKDELQDIIDKTN